MNPKAEELARAVLAKHAPSREDSWASCLACGQAYRGANESFPVFPCDARALAEAVLGIERPSSDKTVYLYSSDHKYLGAMPVREAAERVGDGYWKYDAPEPPTRAHAKLELLLALDAPAPAELRRIAELTALLHSDEAAWPWWQKAALAEDPDAVDYLLELISEAEDPE